MLHSHLLVPVGHLIFADVSSLMFLLQPLHFMPMIDASPCWVSPSITVANLSTCRLFLRHDRRCWLNMLTNSASFPRLIMWEPSGVLMGLKAVEYILLKLPVNVGFFHLLGFFNIWMSAMIMVHFVFLFPIAGCHSVFYIQQNIIIQYAEIICIMNQWFANLLSLSVIFSSLQITVPAKNYAIAQSRASCHEPGRAGAWRRH